MRWFPKKVHSSSSKRLTGLTRESLATATTTVSSGYERLYQNRKMSAATGKFRFEWTMMIPSSAKAKSVWPLQQKRS